MYYLQSRYFDPETGRFINADTIDYLDPSTLGGLNLYSYCNNNPVMRIDPNGNVWWEWLVAGLVVSACIAGAVFTGGTSLVGLALVGAAIGGSVSIASQAISGNGFNWGQFALDLGVGAVTGLVGGSGISRLGSGLVGAAIGGLSSVGSQLIGGTSFADIDWLSVGIGAVLGGAAGWFAGAGLSNYAAQIKNPAISKGMASLNKVIGKMQSGLYSSARYAKTAMTNVSNRITKEFSKYFISSIIKLMVAYGTSTIAYSAWALEKHKLPIY